MNEWVNLLLYFYTWSHRVKLRTDILRDILLINAFFTLFTFSIRLFTIPFHHSRFFYCYLLKKVHLHHFSKIKVIIRKSQNSRNHRFLLLFLLDDRRIRILIHTSDERIRIHEAQIHTCPTDPDPQQCKKLWCHNVCSAVLSKTGVYK